MLDLKNSMRLVATKLNTKVEDRGEDLFLIDVPLRYKDDSWRYHFVWGRKSPKIAKGDRDTFHFQSRVGVLRPDIDLKALLVEAKYGIYTMICIIEEPDKDGNMVDMVYVQASPIVDFSHDEDLIYYCVTECAEVADFLEKKFWGDDKH